MLVSFVFDAFFGEGSGLQKSPKAGPKVEDFGGHVGDLLARGQHQKLNDVHAHMPISGDRRSHKTGLKTGCTKR